MEGSVISIKVKGPSSINFRDVLEEPMRAYVADCVSEGLKFIDSVVPVDKGTLRESFHESGGITGISGEFPRITGTIGTALPHGGMLNAGGRRGPGKPPPLKNIQRWLARRGMDTRIAFAIAQGIAKRGTVTGPNYVAGENADSPIKGYFDKTEQYMATVLAAGPLQRLVADTRSRWARGGG